MKRHYVGVATLCLAVASVIGAVVILILAATNTIPNDKFSLFILGAGCFLLGAILGFWGTTLRMTRFERNYTKHVRKGLNDV